MHNFRLRGGSSVSRCSFLLLHIPEYLVFVAANIGSNSRHGTVGDTMSKGLDIIRTFHTAVYNALHELVVFLFGPDLRSWSRTHRRVHNFRLRGGSSVSRCSFRLLHIPEYLVFVAANISSNRRHATVGNTMSKGLDSLRTFHTVLDNAFHELLVFLFGPDLRSWSRTHQRSLLGRRGHTVRLRGGSSVHRCSLPL